MFTISQNTVKEVKSNDNAFVDHDGQMKVCFPGENCWHSKDEAYKALVKRLKDDMASELDIARNLKASIMRTTDDLIDCRFRSKDLSRKLKEIKNEMRKEK